MDTESLVESGKKVLHALAEDHLHVQLAFWAKLSIYDDWKLFVTSPELDVKPILEGHLRVFTAIEPKFFFEQPPVILLRSEDPLARAMEDEVKTRGGNKPIRVVNKQMGNRYVEDCYIYAANEIPN